MGAGFTPSYSVQMDGKLRTFNILGTRDLHMQPGYLFPLSAGDSQQPVNPGILPGLRHRPLGAGGSQQGSPGSGSAEALRFLFQPRTGELGGRTPLTKKAEETLFPNTPSFPGSRDEELTSLGTFIQAVRGIRCHNSEGFIVKS